MERLALLRQLSFGARVAEEETAELANYFVETDQWLRIFNGEVDIIRGHKGSGKSAIYSLLVTKTNELFDKGVLLVTAERPQGSPVFSDLVADPPTSEAQFVGLWKLYIAALLAQRLKEMSLSGSAAAKLFAALEEQGLLEPDADLARVFRSVRDYARKWLTPQSIEGGIKIDPNTGAFDLSGKITPGEPSTDLRAKGYVSLDHLLGLADAALKSVGYQVWVLLDRLDVAFAETHDLERNALRALFRVYLDMAGLTQVRLKIFLRNDIWDRIVEGGFREASHIVRVAELEWPSASLLNLMVRRLLKNSAIISEFGIDRAAVLSDFDQQNSLYYRFFPDQVEQGSRKPKTLDWMLSRCADATGKTAPRELIHLMIALREREIARLERGEEQPANDQLFDRSVFKTALPTVSEARLIQTLYAEFPELKSYLVQLKGEKTEQTAESLSAIWSADANVTTDIAQQLIGVGFFQARGSRDHPTYWVPFLYRDALEMSQGLAEETDD